MLMNDLNSSQDNKRSFSPLLHDYEGRFSRKGEKLEPVETNPNWLDSLLSALFISFLLMTDFMLFAGSGNIQVFDNPYFPSAEVSLVLAGIGGVSALLIVALHQYRKVKHLLVAGMALLFVSVVFIQFNQYLYNIAVGQYLIPLYIVLGALSAGLSFVVFEYKRTIYRLLAVVAVAVLFFHVYIAYIGGGKSHEFVESYNVQKPSEQKRKLFVYLLLPNLTSYSYLSTFDTTEAERTQQIMLGFWQNNDFRLFSRAYVPDNNHLYNMVSAFNLNSENNYRKDLSDTKMLSGYWRFYNLRNEFIHLKNNELYDVFHHSKFQVSAYKSRDFDMCRKNHGYNVERCVEKVNRPTNLYDMDMSTAAKAGILTIDWLSSMEIFGGITSKLYNLLSPVMNVDKMPMIGTNYNNLYVVNSVKTFDILLDDIKKDSGKQAYFVYADVPSDMYIYDEFCHINPQQEWLNRSNLPWIEKDYTEQRQSAYLQQTRCLFGKMQQFIDALKEQGLWQDTVLIVQGTSGVNNFQNGQIEDVTENFIANRLVSMAIHDQNMEEYSEDERFCSTNDIIAGYLFNEDRCSTSHLEIHGNMIDNILNIINRLINKVNANYQESFTEWYNGWQKVIEGGKSDDVVLKGSNIDYEAENEDAELKQSETGVEKLNLNESVFAE